jgi:DNA polymerase III subunit epsilon
MPWRLSFWRPSRHGNLSRRTRLDSVRWVVLDSELTSLDSQSNRLLSVGAIVMEGGKIRLGEQFYRVVNPGVAVPVKTILVHGLRPTDLAEGEPPRQVLQELREFCAGAVLVGHFVRIDLDVLRKEYRAAGPEFDFDFDTPAIDTARVHRWLSLRNKRSPDAWDDRTDRFDLISVARAHQIEVEDSHHALYDAFLTARLWQKLLNELALAKVQTLGELLRIAGE